MTTYTVTITHDDDGELAVTVDSAGHSEADRASIAWALRATADLIEVCEVVERSSFC
jgi:hypothetical protein